MVPIQVYNLIHFKIYVYKAITKIKEKNIVFFILLLPKVSCASYQFPPIVLPALPPPLPSSQTTTNLLFVTIL